MDTAVLMAMLAFAIGYLSGTWLEAFRWASNADRIQRIEWRGKLFKVSHD